MHCDLLGRTAAHSSLLGRWNWVRGAFGNKQPNKDWANSFTALIKRCQLPASSQHWEWFLQIHFGRGNIQNLVSGGHMLVAGPIWLWLDAYKR